MPREEEADEAEAEAEATSVAASDSAAAAPLVSLLAGISSVLVSTRHPRQHLLPLHLTRAHSHAQRLETNEL